MLRVAIGTICAGDLGRALGFLLRDDTTAPDGAAHVMARDVDGDAEDPRPRRRSTVEAPRRARDLHEHGLNQIVEIGRGGSRKPREEAVRGAVVSVEELAERFRFTPHEPREERVVRDGAIEGHGAAHGRNDEDHSITRAPTEPQGMESVSPV